jgi:calmodulin
MSQSASASVAPSPSTALLHGTLIVQSSPAALAAAANAAATPTAIHSSSSSARLPVVEYKGEHGDSSDLRSVSVHAHAMATASSAARRAAAKLQSREELRAAFGVFDSSGLGQIAAEEFASVYRMLVAGVSDAEIAELLATLDSNKDGVIDFEEFAALMHRRAQAQLRLAGGSTLLDDALAVFDPVPVASSSNPGSGSGAAATAAAAGGDPPAATLLDARMSVSELLHICDLLKENLSVDETDTLLRDMHVEADGTFNYARLVQQMLPGGM